MNEFHRDAEAQELIQGLIDLRIQPLANRLMEICQALATSDIEITPDFLVAQGELYSAISEGLGTAYRFGAQDGQQPFAQLLRPA